MLAKLIKSSFLCSGKTNNLLHHGKEEKQKAAFLYCKGRKEG